MQYDKQLSSKIFLNVIMVMEEEEEEHTPLPTLESPLYTPSSPPSLSPYPSPPPSARSTLLE